MSHQMTVGSDDEPTGDAEDETAEDEDAPAANPAEDEDAPAANPAEEVMLSLSMDLGSATQEAAMRQLIADFEAENPNIKVELNTTSYQQVLEQLPLLLESGDAPDLMKLTNYNLREYFLDLSPLRGRRVLGREHGSDERLAVAERE